MTHARLHLAASITCAFALIACETAPPAASPPTLLEPPAVTAPPNEQIDIELIPHQAIDVPGLGITAELVEARRGHTSSGGMVSSGVVRLVRGDEVVDHAYDKDGPFEALGHRWAVWGAGAQLSMYPEGVPIHP